MLSVQSKSDVKSVQSKSDAKSIQSKSDAKSVQSKSDVKSVQSKSDAKSIQSKSDAKSVQSKSDAKSTQSKSDAKSTQSKSDTKSIQSKSDAKSNSKQDAKPAKPSEQSLTIVDGMTGTTLKGLSPNTPLKTVLKQLLTMKNIPLTQETLQDWSLVRSLDLFNPLPLDKTLRDCGIKDMEALICFVIAFSSRVGRPVSKITSPNTIIVGMDCDGLVFYEAAKDESVKSVMRHFLGLREKREVTKEDLKQYSLVVKDAPTQVLSKKKTLEECGVTNNTILERSVSYGDSA